MVIMKNAASFFSAIVSGFAQIGFTDNKLSGILIITACFIGYPTGAASGSISIITATVLAMILKAPLDSLQKGLFGFNSALTGLAIPLFINFNTDGLQVTELIFFSITGGIISLFLTFTFKKIFDVWKTPSLSLPYVVTVMIIIPCADYFGDLKIFSALPVGDNQIIIFGHSFTENFVIIFANFSEIILNYTPLPGIIFAIALLASSAKNFLLAIAGSIIALITSFTLDLPMNDLLIGLYGYNSILLMISLLGRTMVINVRSIILSMFLCSFSTFLTASMLSTFSKLNIPITALPFITIFLIIHISRDYFKGLEFENPADIK